MANQHGKSIITRYTQQVLSNWGSGDKQGNKGSGGNEKGELEWNVSPDFWKQESYTVLVPVVIKRIAVLNGEHSFQVSIPTNVDILVSPTSGTSKGALKQVSSIPKAQDRDNSKVSLVYGISTSGSYSLSHPSESEVPKTIAYVYGRILGQVHRAIECWLLQSGKVQKPDDTRDGNSVSQGRKGSMGKHKKKGRDDTIRRKIRDENHPEETTEMAELNGEVLGF